MKRFVFLFLLLPALSQAQPLLPDTVYAWKRVELRAVGAEEWDAMADTNAELLRAYDVREVTEAVYVRESAAVRMRVMTLTGRARAFGLFRALAPEGSVHGIVGDAFVFGERELCSAFGPFVLQCAALGRRDPRPDEALLLAAKRALFRQADCYGSDIPLPAEERLLGSERYLVPSPESWSALDADALSPLRELLWKHAAWTAQYEKPRLGVRRILISFPFRQSVAGANFAAQLRSRCADRGIEIPSACGTRAYRFDDAVMHVALARDRVLLVISDVRDGGCCAWVESLRNE
jgi:hypothetical protein